MLPCPYTNSNLVDSGSEYAWPNRCWWEDNTLQNTPEELDQGSPAAEEPGTAAAAAVPIPRQDMGTAGGLPQRAPGAPTASALAPAAAAAVWGDRKSVV